MHWHLVPSNGCRSGWTCSVWGHSQDPPPPPNTVTFGFKKKQDVVGQTTNQWVMLRWVATWLDRSLTDLLAAAVKSLLISLKTAWDTQAAFSSDNCELVWVGRKMFQFCSTFLTFKWYLCSTPQWNIEHCSTCTVMHETWLLNWLLEK